MRSRVAMLLRYWLTWPLRAWRARRDFKREAIAPDTTARFSCIVQHGCTVGGLMFVTTPRDAKFAIDDLQPTPRSIFMGFFKGDGTGHWQIDGCELAAGAELAVILRNVSRRPACVLLGAYAVTMGRKVPIVLARDRDRGRDGDQETA